MTCYVLLAVCCGATAAACDVPNLCCEANVHALKANHNSCLQLPPHPPSQPILPTPQGPGSAAKKRRALLRGLSGAWGDIALGGSGSHFVEKAYALAVSAL